MIKICQYFWDKMVNYCNKGHISSDRLYLCICEGYSDTSGGVDLLAM